MQLVTEHNMFSYLKENVFGTRAQSEQRAFEKFHAPIPLYSKVPK